MEKSLPDDQFLILASSYTDGFFAKDIKGEGVSTFVFDPKAKTLESKTIFSLVPNISFLSFSSTENIILGASEMENGAFVTLQINNDFGLKLVNSFETKGKDACHICLDEQNGVGIVTNYNSGNFSVFSLDKHSGIILERLQTVDLPFLENGPVKERQEMAHAHCSAFHKNSNTIYIADLGGDKIHIFTFEPLEKKCFSFKKQPFFKVESGFGPRHLFLSQNGKNLYCLNELQAFISVFSVGEDGMLGLVQTIQTIFGTNLKENYNADIKIHRSQKFLLSSNRGYDVLSVYRIDEQNGGLTFLRHIDTCGFFYFLWGF